MTTSTYKLGAALLALLLLGTAARAELVTTAPAGATIVVEGGPATVQGRLVQTDTRERAVYVTDLTSTVYEHQPRHGAYIRVEHLTLRSENGHDLQGLAALLGSEARVTLTGSFQRFPLPGSSWSLPGMIVTGLRLRGHALPGKAPSEGELLAAARAATERFIKATRPEVTIEGPLTGRHLGDLRVQVSTWLRPDWSGPEFPRVYEFDALTGAVKLIQ